MASCKVQECKKEARHSINGMFLGQMMIRGKEFVESDVKPGKRMSDLSFWCLLVC